MEFGVWKEFGIREREPCGAATKVTMDTKDTKDETESAQSLI
jgi:hypothetical protein